MHARMLFLRGQTRSMEPTIRRFTTADQDHVRALVLTGLAQHWDAPIDPTLNPDLDDIAASYAHGTTLVAVMPDGAVVGTGTIVPRGTATAQIVRMSVATEHRGHGIGQRLVYALIDIAGDGWGRPAIQTIVLETTATWTATIRFYQRCGFAITHHTDGEFGRDTWFARDVRPELGGFR